MAHHLLANDTAAIFSPSVARIAASTARDWSYVDSWLKSKFPDRPAPAFERNPDTLKALLALASFNESADEERQLVAKADAEILKGLKDAEVSHRDSPRDTLLDAIESELPKDGEVALDGMATMAVQAGIPFPEPEDLGRRMIDHQRSIFEAEQMKARVNTLQRYIVSDAGRVNGFREALQGDDYTLRPELAKQNLDQQRKVKAMAAQIHESQHRVASLAASQKTSHPLVQDIAREEQKYLDLLSEKKQLHLRLAAFEGLPSDPDQARAELEALQEQLRGTTTRRDAVFEGLVERESPIKRRK
jgi:HAUS augmin-like complex subunit 1